MMCLSSVVLCRDRPRAACASLVCGGSRSTRLPILCRLGNCSAQGCHGQVGGQAHGQEACTIRNFCRDKSELSLQY